MITFEMTALIRTHGDGTVDRISVECTEESFLLEIYEYADGERRHRRVSLTYAEVDEMKRIADVARDIIKQLEVAAKANKQRSE